MILLPIAARELRVRARRWSTYNSRMLAVLLASLCGGIVFGLVFLMPASTAGRTFFVVLSILAFLFCVFEGLHQTVDSVSEEKRDGTLGLLFLTDLRAYDIVIGKLSASSLNVVYAFLGMAPVLGLSLLMGGVTLGQFGRMMLALLNTLFYVLCLGLRVSCSVREQGRAWSLAVGTCLIIGLIMPAFGSVSFFAGAPLVEGEIGKSILWLVGSVFIGVSPVSAFSLAVSGSTPAGPNFWICLGIAHLTGWYFLYRASRLLPNSWQDNPALAPPLPPSAMPAPMVPSAPAIIQTRSVKSALREQLLNLNPATWLALRRAHGATPVWMLASMGVLWALLVLPDADFFGPALFLMTMTKLAFRIWVAVFAARFFVQARKDGALELLLSTPVTVQQIIRGQWLALRRLFLGPALLLTAADVAGWAIVSDDRMVTSIYTFGWVASLMFPVQLATLASLSMWLAFRLRRPTRAAGLSLALGWILPLLCFFPGAVLAQICLLLWGQYRLRRDLRGVAARF